jgi:hypothetical protein
MNFLRHCANDLIEKQLKLAERWLEMHGTEPKPVPTPFSLAAMKVVKENFRRNTVNDFIRNANEELTRRKISSSGS